MGSILTLSKSFVKSLSAASHDVTILTQALFEEDEEEVHEGHLRLIHLPFPLRIITLQQ